MHRFFIPPEWIHGSRVVLHDEVAHQLRTVLRMQPGVRITVLDNRGREYEVTLTQITRERAEGDVCEVREATGEPHVQLTLYQCLLKKDNFEWVLQKCTELGVSRFVPVESQRTVVPLSSLRDNKLARWQRIVTEAAEQSGRGRLPVLDEPRPFDDAVRDLAGQDLAMIPWEEAESGSVADVAAPLKANRLNAPRVGICVGPEGGFTPQEVALATEAGARIITLGPRILRAETAALAASLLALHELGETSCGPGARGHRNTGDSA